MLGVTLALPDYTVTRKLIQLQGVVTYMSPVEVFVTGIKIFDWQKVLVVPSKAFECYVRGQIVVTHF